MENKPIIAVDVDDVIAANAAGFVEYSNKKYGTHLTLNDYEDRWAEVWKVEWEEAERRAVEYHESGHIATYGIIYGANEALLKLKEKYKLIVVTTRRKVINQLTKEWIEKYYPGIFEEVVLSGFFDSPAKENTDLTKGDLVKKIGADYIIDDQIKHVESAAKNGVRGLLFGDYSWNRKENLPENVVRVKNWDEVLKYFDLK